MSAPPRSTIAAEPHTPVREIRTTSGVLAVTNLQAQIAGLEGLDASGLLSTVQTAALVELIALRGHLLGRISDYERAEERAEQLCCDHSEDGAAALSRARSRARFHGFGDALDDLDAAEQLGAASDEVTTERAAILQAIGRYDEALVILSAAVERRADFTSLGALAVFHAERAETDEAERLFKLSRNHYRGVSPIPLALLDFQRGHMWMAHGDLHRARAWFTDAHRRLPGYVAAQGHLGEVEAILGHHERAIALLRPLAESVEDPDYAAALSRVLHAAGHPHEADAWRADAARRYDTLLARHRNAFADHAADFLLSTGGDLQRALALARCNLELRPTLRAQRLFTRTTAAANAVSPEDISR